MRLLCQVLGWCCTADSALTSILGLTRSFFARRNAFSDSDWMWNCGEVSNRLGDTMTHGGGTWPAVISAGRFHDAMRPWTAGGRLIWPVGSSNEEG